MPFGAVDFDAFVVVLPAEAGVWVADEDEGGGACGAGPAGGGFDGRWEGVMVLISSLNACSTESRRQQPKAWTRRQQRSLRSC